MIPDTIKFTELEIEPRELLDHPFGMKCRGAWPIAWTRHQFAIDTYDEPLESIDRWMAKNIQGRWGSHCVSVRPGERLICLAFELLNEAIMFRLKEGETAWREEDDP